jgi:putative transposase
MPRKQVLDLGVKLSIGAVGDRYDNAMIEAFCGRMQTGLLDRQSWMTYIEVTTAMAEYIEVFNNQQHRHSSLNMLTPTEYEMLKINQPQLA